MVREKRNFIKSQDYILFPDKNEVYIKAMRTSIFVDDEMFQEMKRLIYKEQYEMRKRKGKELSYNKKLSEDSDFDIELLDMLADERYVPEKMVIETLENFPGFSKLSEVKQDILIRRYVYQQSMIEIAKIRGVSRQYLDLQRLKALKILKEEYEREIA